MTRDVRAQDLAFIVLKPGSWWTPKRDADDREELVSSPKDPKVRNGATISSASPFLPMRSN